MAQERAAALKDQFIMDMHTHFLRDDTRLVNFVRSREAVGKAGWNPDAGRQAADARRPQVQQLLQGNLPRQRHQDRADLVVAVGNPARLVPHQRDDDRGARQGEQGGRRAAHVRARDLHARLGRLARASRRLAAAQAGIDQGLHGRRQHQQGRGQASVADGRREGHLQGLRAVRETRHQERLRAQGPVPARDRGALAAPAAIRDGRRRRQGREGLAAAQLRDLSRRLSPRRRRPRRGRLERVRADRPRVLGLATSPRSRRSTASPTSMPTSASCSRRAWWRSRGSAPR